MIPYDLEFGAYTCEKYVKQYFPTAHVKDENFLDRVYVDVNGLSTWREIGNGVTEDRAWQAAAEWVYYEYEFD